MKFIFEPVKEVLEMPSGSNTAIPLADILRVGCTKQLHSHHSEDEDDDTEDHNQVRDGGHSALHDSQDVIERLP